MESVEYVEDPELIRETLDGSPVAFGELVRRYQGDVRMIVSRWIQCPATADDLAQDVFVAAYQSLSSFDYRGSMRAWLIGIAKNKVKLSLRAQARRRNHELSLFQCQIQQWKAQELEREMLEETSEQGSLRTCMEKLAPESRRLIEQHYFDGKPLESIARESNRTSGSLRMMLMRIRKALAKCIRGQHQ